MSETYLIERAETCRRLAHEESDAEMRDMLHHLENDYRVKARRARQHDRMIAAQQPQA